MSRDRRRVDPIAAPLAQLLQRIDPEHRLRVYRVWQFWAEEVGDTIAARARPAGYHAGILSVRVNGHAWMQELQFLKETLRERLNARLDEPLIRDIYFTSVASAPTPRARANPSAPDAQPPAPPVPLPPINDERLAAVFARIVTAHARRGTRSREGESR